MHFHLSFLHALSASGGIFFYRLVSLVAFVVLSPSMWAGRNRDIGMLAILLFLSGGVTDTPGTI